MIPRILTTIPGFGHDVRSSYPDPPRRQHANQDFGDARQAIINLRAAGGWAPSETHWTYKVGQ